MKSFENNIATIEAKIGYIFENKTLLKQAFTRSSYTNEYPDACDNEVLEFLGDSALHMIVAKHLSKRYTIQNHSDHYYKCELDEKELTDYKIDFVERKALAPAIEKAGLEQYLLLGKSDIDGNIQNEASVKEDLFEAILGAVAIDSHWNVTWLETVVKTLLDIDLQLDSCSQTDLENETEFAKKYNHQIVVFEEIPSICERLKYGYAIKFGDNIFNETFYGYGNTQDGARKMALKRAEERCTIRKDRKTTIIEAVGQPDYNRAINQLQELYYKKYIPEPNYIFSQYGSFQNGSPQWSCKCVLKDVWEPDGEYIATTKREAKKQAAYETLNALIGRDLSKLFSVFGTEVQI